MIAKVMTVWYRDCARDYRRLTGESSAQHRRNQWRLGGLVDVRQEMEYQTVAGHRVQDTRQREYRAQKTVEIMTKAWRIIIKKN